MAAPITERQTSSAQDAPQVEASSGPVRVQRSEFLARDWEPTQRALEIVGEHAGCGLELPEEVKSRLDAERNRILTGFAAWHGANQFPGDLQPIAAQLFESVLVEVLALLAGVPVAVGAFSDLFWDGLRADTGKDDPEAFCRLVEDLSLYFESTPDASHRRRADGFMEVEAEWRFDLDFQHDEEDSEYLVIRVEHVFSEDCVAALHSNAIPTDSVAAIVWRRTGVKVRGLDLHGGFPAIRAQLTGRAS